MCIDDESSDVVNGATMKMMLREDDERCDDAERCDDDERCDDAERCDDDER